MKFLLQKQEEENKSFSKILPQKLFQNTQERNGKSSGEETFWKWKTFRIFYNNKKGSKKNSRGILILRKKFNFHLNLKSEIFH